MPLQETSGAASYDAFGGGPPFEPVYIESVFSTWLYTGTGSAQTITNGIDLAGKGGLVWVKSRSAVKNHCLCDTNRGVSQALASNTTGGQDFSATNYVNAFNADGFGVGAVGDVGGSGVTFGTWTFRKQPKFFDVVTYTGNGTAGRTVAHSLGSVPGCIIVKRTDAANGWPVYHRAMDATPQNYQMRLNADIAKFTTSPVSRWNNTAPTSTVFTLSDNDEVNGNGATYVAYLFAHDAGGFGLTGTDNVISCGSYTGNGSTSGPTITLGYEPQWVLIKESSAAGNQWVLFDNMRGMPVGSNDNYLFPNLSNAESSAYDLITPTATGFSLAQSLGIVNASGSTYIYIAIRRGPMKTPTTGTSVFQPTTFTSQAGADTVSSGSVPVVDWGFVKLRTSTQLWIVGDRLRGGPYLSFDTTSAEASNVFAWDKQNSFVTDVSDTPASFIGYSVRRAPGFFDVVCYTGTGSATTVAHNLGVVPELMIVKSRSSGIYDWRAYSSAIGATKYLKPNGDSAEVTSSAVWNDTTPTSSVFTVGSNATVNASGGTYVAYLFASCPGVSKVGSYTGTGTTLQIDCGFTGGARFVLIKRTDSTGDWYVWDSARGIVSGNDPYLRLNSTAAEVTNTNWINTTSNGFELTDLPGNLVNINGASYIFLAIA